MPIDEEGSAIRAASRIVSDTVPFCGQALSLVLSTHMLAMNTAAVQPAIDSLAIAKRVDDALYSADCMLCECLRRRGMCKIDVKGWLYE
jgi:hypothetical protein